MIQRYTTPQMSRSSTQWCSSAVRMAIPIAQGKARFRAILRPARDLELGRVTLGALHNILLDRPARLINQWALSCTRFHNPINRDLSRSWAVPMRGFHYSLAHLNDTALHYAADVAIEHPMVFLRCPHRELDRARQCTILGHIVMGPSPFVWP